MSQSCSYSYKTQIDLLFISYENHYLRWLPCKAWTYHCVYIVQIRSFSGPYFPVFGANTEIYFGNLHIQSKYGKIRTRKGCIWIFFAQCYTCKLYKVGGKNKIRKLYIWGILRNILIFWPYSRSDLQKYFCLVEQTCSTPLFPKLDML